MKGRATAMELLVVEDDPVIGKALRKGFTEAGHSCRWVRTGDEGFLAAADVGFDAIVLDLMLPGMGGIELLRKLRETGDATPIIVLTALGSVEDRVSGLNLGADDYLVKPFDFAELMARVDAIRRRSVRPAPLLSVGDLQLDLTTRKVTRGSREVDLTPTEFSILELLMRYQGQVVTRRMLCEHLWESDWEGTTNVIEVHMNRLRGKLASGSEASAIQTVRGRGYVLKPE